jgi:hypothetical protein
MKAVTWEVDGATLERRRRTGVERFDEMWEGVLHMAPAPTNRHQEIAQAVPPGPDGRTLIAALDVDVRAESGAGGFLLHVRVAGDPASERSM